MEQLLISCSYLFGAVIVFGQVFCHYRISSICFYITFFTTLLLWICTMTECFDKVDLLAELIIVTSLTFVVINGILHGAAFSFDYIKKLIMFDSTVIYFTAASKLKIEKKTYQILKWIYIGIALVLIYAYIKYDRQMYYLNGAYTDYLTFRFTNPNLAAVFLCCMAMFLITMGTMEKKIVQKLFLWMIAAVEIAFIYQTEARNGMIAVCAFAVCLLVSFFLGKKGERIPKWGLLLAAAFPLIFAGVYLMMIRNTSFTGWFSFLVEEGKGLDSRDGIWRLALNRFLESPLVGAYYQSSDGTGSFQFHNTHIDMLASYGILVFLMIILLLYQLMLRVQEREQGYLASLMISGFAGALILGCGEATIFSGGLGGYIFAGIFLYAMPGEAEENKSDSKIFEENPVPVVYKSSLLRNQVLWTKKNSHASGRIFRR